MTMCCIRRRFAMAILAGVACLGIQSNALGSMITNGSFETGDFTGWDATDLATPFDPLSVASTGTLTAFDGFLGTNSVIASHGTFAATNGFDGEGLLGPTGAISLAQDIGVIAAGDILTFDYRAGWDLISFTLPSSFDRMFEVFIEPAGGGAPIATFTELTAVVGTDTSGSPNSDTGALSGMIDLTPFAGLAARVNFKWTIPDNFSGPANAQLDNVAISHAVPEPATLALLGFGLAGLGFRRRRS